MPQDSNETGLERAPGARSAGILSGMAVFHLLILGVCVTAFVLTLSFAPVPPPLRRGMSPETFPRIILALIAILTLFSFLRETKTTNASKMQTIPPVFAFSVSCLLGLLLIGVSVDLLLSIFFFIAVVMWLWGERRPVFIGATAIIVPIVLFVLFSEVLGIRFPRGLIVNLIYG
uniref:tripartite tricarboxylate transporter TctB family protein n=1 Tax=Pararhizobium sp. IMCC3301 TaxID=3067904 RepID=UPI002741242A|nr:tripartite tricarboxylate transporter TctB family protein [Pararhizobium sp. IMCC3301]